MTMRYITSLEIYQCPFNILLTAEVALCLTGLFNCMGKISASLNNMVFDTLMHETVISLGLGIIAPLLVLDISVHQPTPFNASAPIGYLYICHVISSARCLSKWIGILTYSAAYWQWQLQITAYESFVYNGRVTDGNEIKCAGWIKI